MALVDATPPSCRSVAAAPSRFTRRAIEHAQDRRRVHCPRADLFAVWLPYDTALIRPESFEPEDEFLERQFYTHGVSFFLGPVSTIRGPTGGVVAVG